MRARPRLEEESEYELPLDFLRDFRRLGFLRLWRSRPRLVLELLLLLLLLLLLGELPPPPPPSPGGTANGVAVCSGVSATVLVEDDLCNNADPLPELGNTPKLLPQRSVWKSPCTGGRPWVS